MHTTQHPRGGAEWATAPPYFALVGWLHQRSRGKEEPAQSVSKLFDGWTAHAQSIRIGLTARRRAQALFFRHELI